MPIQNKQFLMPVMRKPNKINYPGFTQQLQPFNHYRKTLDCPSCYGEGGWVEIYRDNCCRPNITRNANTVLNKDYFTTREEYTYSRCQTYEQRLSVKTNDGVTKSTCTRGCKVIYNPNNKKFSQQGATSSGNRLQRLKYDTLASRGNYYPGSVNKPLNEGKTNCKNISNYNQQKNVCN
jgi:hypothetical protein